MLDYICERVNGELDAMDFAFRAKVRIVPTRYMSYKLYFMLQAPTQAHTHTHASAHASPIL